MAKADIILLFTILIYLPCVSAKWLITCDRKNDAYKCCNRYDGVYCQGSGRIDDCSITDQSISVEHVFVKRYRMQSLSQSSRMNTSKQPVEYLQFEYIIFHNIDMDPFDSLPTLRKDLKLRFNDLNILAISGALDDIQGSKHVSMTLTNICIRDEHMNSLSAKLVASSIGYLNLKRNQLTTIPLYILQQLVVLHTAIFKEIKISKLSVRTVMNLNSLVLDDYRMANGTVWQNIDGHLPSVTNLSLVNNAIDSLSIIEWRHLPSLRYLNLSSNRIQYLNYTVLQSLKELQTLDLSGNWISKMTYLKDQMPITSLKKLSLAGNHFSEFSPWFCSRNGTSIFQNLEYLDLSYNQLQYLVADAWRCLYNLKGLDLSANPIVKIKNNTFADLYNLEELVLADNRNGGLVTAEAAAFNNSNLQRLYLKASKLRFSENSTLLEMFKFTRNLTELDLSNNMLGGLNDIKLFTLFSPLRNLERLFLRKCYLNGLPPGLLENLSQLTTLSLDNNTFETRTIPASFQGAVNIQYLSLSSNFIRVIHNYSFSRNLTLSLTHLNLANNPFDCSCDNRWLFEQINRSSTKTNTLDLVSWPEQYICRTPETESGRLLQDFHFDASKCEPLSGIVVAYSTIGCFCFAFIVTTIIVYKLRWHFTYWWYKILWNQEVKTDTEQLPILRNNCTYNAYSIYSQRDEVVGTFLVNEFSPMMNRLGYKVFIWDRDAGCGATVSEIGNAMYQSENAVAIITNSFLKDQWCKFQIEVALDREIELKREFLTILVLDEVDFKLLSTFWCVRFTKTPTMQWCSTKNDVQRKALEAFIQKQIRKPEAKDSTTHSSDMTRD